MRSQGLGYFCFREGPAAAGLRSPLCSDALRAGSGKQEPAKEFGCREGAWPAFCLHEEGMESQGRGEGEDRSVGAGLTGPRQLQPPPRVRAAPPRTFGP